MRKHCATAHIYHSVQRHFTHAAVSKTGLFETDVNRGNCWRSRPIGDLPNCVIRETTQCVDIEMKMDEITCYICAYGRLSSLLQHVYMRHVLSQVVHNILDIYIYLLNMARNNSRRSTHWRMTMDDWSKRCCMYHTILDFSRCSSQDCAMTSYTMTSLWATSDSDNLSMGRRYNDDDDNLHHTHQDIRTGLLSPKSSLHDVQGRLRQTCGSGKDN